MRSGYRSRDAASEVREVRGEVRVRGGRDEHLDGVAVWLKLRVEVEVGLASMR